MVKGAQLWDIRLQNIGKNQVIKIWMILVKYGDMYPLDKKLNFYSSWKGQPMKMFLNTDSSSPYCTHNYLLELGKILRRRAFKLSFQWKKIQLPIYFSLQCNFYLFRPGISCRSRNMGPRIPQCYSDWKQRQLGWASALSWVRWIFLNS